MSMPGKAPSAFQYLVLRPATAEDLPQIQALERRAPSAAHWAPQEYEGLFSPQSRRTVFVVTDNGRQVRGFIVANRIDTEWEIENVVVGEESRGKGVGRLLVQSLVDLSKQSGAEQIHLEVRSTNYIARRLYENCGFAISGKRPGYYRDPVDDAITYSIKGLKP